MKILAARPDTSKVPHRKATIGPITYYLCRYPEGDYHIHQKRPNDDSGYAGAVVSFLLEDGTVERVKGPYDCDGAFSNGERAVLADHFKDPSILVEANRLRVGTKLMSCYTSDERTIIYEEHEWHLDPPEHRLRPEWAPFEIAIHFRGGCSYQKYSEFNQQPTKGTQ